MMTWITNGVPNLMHNLITYTQDAFQCIGGVMYFLSRLKLKKVHPHDQAKEPNKFT